MPGASTTLPTPSSWREHAAVLSEATQALLVAAVEAAESDKGSQKLSTSAARFDSLAATLEESLLALAVQREASRPPCRMLSANRRALLRELAASFLAEQANELHSSKRARKDT